MKTSKRMLAIVLALVMSFGFVLSASAAEYTYADQDKVSAEYADAVAFMKELGIMGGSSTVANPDVWEFRPDAKLMRSEVCKILFVLYTTGDNADNFKDMAGFTDVAASAWFAGYVNWAKSKGVVSGSNAAGTTFSPSGNVKLVEACKMFLVAMGYDATKENLVGTNWEGFTMSLALQSGLLDGLESISNTAELTREQLAQLCSNTLDANSVRYDENDSAYETSDTVLKKYFKFDEIPGLVIATPQGYLPGEGASEASAAGKVTLALFAGDKYAKDMTVDISHTLGLEYLGRTVKFLVKATAKTNSDDKITSYTAISKVYSVSYDDKIFTATAGDVKINSAEKLVYTDDDKKDHTSLDVVNEDNSVLFVGYERTQAKYASANATLNKAIATLGDHDDDDTTPDTWKYSAIDAEDPATIVCDSKGNIVRVLVKDYSFAEVAVSNSGKVTIKGAFSNVSKDDIIVGKDLAVKGRFMLGYKINDKYGIDAPTVITAKMSSIRGTAQDTYVINNKEYKLSTLTGATTDTPNGLRNKDATYYVLGDKILKAVGDADDKTTSDYCVITASNWSVSGASSGKAYVDVLTNGNVTYSDLVVKDGKFADYGTADAQKGKIFKFSLSSDKKTITLTALTAGTDEELVTTGNVTVAEGVSVTLSTGAKPKKIIGDDSVFFVYDTDDDEFYTYKGAKLPKLNNLTKAADGTPANISPSVVRALIDTTDNSIIAMLMKGVPDSSTEKVTVRGLITSAESIPDFADDEEEMVMFTVLVDDSDVPAVFYTRKDADGDGLTDTSISALCANVHVMLHINAYDVETVNGNSYNVISQFSEIAPSGWLTASASEKEGVYGGYITYKTSKFLTLTLKTGANTQNDLDLTFASDVEIYSVNDDDEVTTESISGIATFEETMEVGKWNAVVSLNADKEISKIFIYENDELWD